MGFRYYENHAEYTDDSPYDSWDNREEWLRQHNELEECPNCGAEMKTSKEGNKYCADLYWKD